MPDASRGLGHLILSDDEWTRITKCVAILQVCHVPRFASPKPDQRQFPHFVLQVMSSDKTPVLAGAVPSFEHLMSIWEDMATEDSMQDVAPAIKAALKRAYKYYNRMDHTSAYIVSMCE